MTTFPYGERVTIHHPGTVSGETNAYGSSEPGPGTDEVVVVAVAPGATSEQTVAQSTVSVAFTLYVPAGVTVEADARITVRGDTFEVHGEPAEWSNPFTGWVPGSVVELVRAQ